MCSLILDSCLLNFRRSLLRISFDLCVEKSAVKQSLYIKYNIFYSVFKVVPGKMFQIPFSK